MLTAGFRRGDRRRAGAGGVFQSRRADRAAAMPDIPSPHSPVLLEAAVPDVARITRAIQQLASM